MPTTEKALTSRYRGRKLDLAGVATNEAWSDQGFGRRARALAPRPNVWAHAVERPFGGCDHQFELFLFVHLDGEQLVRKVETGVYQSWSPSALDELKVPFFEPDMMAAVSALDAAVLPEDPQRARRGRRKAPAFTLEGLRALVGSQISGRATKALVTRLGLPRADDAMGGYSYSAAGCRLELQTDRFGLINVAFLSPSEADDLLPGQPKPTTRAQLVAAFGEPTRQSAEAGAWDRWDSATHAIHVTYGGAGGAVERLTVMTADRAP